MNNWIDVSNSIFVFRKRGAVLNSLDRNDHSKSGLACCFCNVSCRIVVHFGLALLLLTISVPIVLAAETLNQRINATVERVVASENIPSVAIGLVREGVPYHVYSSGAIRRGGDTAVNSGSIFQIGSLSKMLTGLVVNHLIIGDRLDPTNSLANLLSATVGYLEVLGNPSLDQLLHHQSGITDDVCSLYRLRVEGQPWSDGYSRDDLIADIRALKSPGRTLGSFHYSNCGYSILGLITEIVTDSSFDEQLTNTISKPYGLQNTVTNLSPSQELALVVPYSKTDREKATKPSQMGMGVPASAIYSTVEDLQKLLTLQLKAYRSKQAERLLNPLFLTSTTVQGPEQFIRYGIGLMEIEHPMGKLYGHDGDADGFASMYLFSPQYNLGIVLLTSSGGSWVADVTFEIMALLIQSTN